MRDGAWEGDERREGVVQVVWISKISNPRTEPKFRISKKPTQSKLKFFKTQPNTYGLGVVQIVWVTEFL